MKRPSFILCWVITTQNAFLKKYFLIRIWIVMFAVWSLGSQPFWLATRMCRSRMESWKDNIRKISRDPVKHQHRLQDKKLCEKKNSPIIFAVLGQQKYFAFSWLQFQLIVVETVEIHLLHFIPLCADFSWTAGRLFLNVDPKPSPWRQLHHHLIAAGHSKKDESGLLFWGLRISFASSNFKVVIHL